MKKALLLFLVAASAGLKGQDCNSFFPSMVGVELGYTNYDSKEKIIGSHLMKVVSVTPGDTTKINTHVDYYNHKEKLEKSLDMVFGCFNNTIIMDMSDIMPSEMNENFSKGKFSITSDNMIIPADAKPGMVLPGGKITMKMEGVENMPQDFGGITISYSDRLVKEGGTITTKAGSFECILIEYTISVKSFFVKNTQVKEWYCKNVGMVKSESYEKDKLQSVTLLTTYKK